MYLLKKYKYNLDKNVMSKEVEKKNPKNLN